MTEYLFDRSVVGTGRRPAATSLRETTQLSEHGSLRRTDDSERSAKNRPTMKGKSKERWERILRSAAQRFYNDGYDATSIRDVAEDADINKGSLYYYIGSKEDLLVGVIENVHHHGLAVLDETRLFDGSATERLRFFLRAHTTYQAEHAIEAAVFDRESRRLNEETLVPILAQRRAYQGYLETLLEEADRESAIRMCADARTTAVAVLGMINSLHLWYQPTGPVPPEELVDYIIGFVMDGLRSGEVGRPRKPLGRSRPRGNR
jgi:AcrR family transcriptional regulator